MFLVEFLRGRSIERRLFSKKPQASTMLLQCSLELSSCSLVLDVFDQRSALTRYVLQKIYRIVRGHFGRHGIGGRHSVAVIGLIQPFPLEHCLG